MPPKLKGSWAGKIGEALDWGQRIKFVFDVVVAVASLKLIGKVLSYVPHLSHDWASVIAWAVSGVILYLLLAWQQRKTVAEPRQTAISSMSQATSMIPPISSVTPGSSAPQFDSKEFFRTAYYSTVTAEAEKNIRLAAQQYDPHNVEGFLCKIIGVGLVQFMNDITWLIMYKSQLDMLSDLNSRNGWMPLADARAYYDKAALAYPEVYSQYSFDQWINYLKSEQLLILHPSAMLEITVRGKDFLKYLTHWGRSPALKKY